MRLLGSSPVGRKGGRKNRRKKRPEALKPVDTLLLREDIPFVPLTGVCGPFHGGRTFGHGCGVELTLLRMMVSHRKEKVPEQSELLFPRDRHEEVVRTLYSLKGGIGRGLKSLCAQLIIHTIVNGVHPTGEIQHWVYFKRKGMLAIIVRQRGTTELTGQDVGEGFKEGCIVCRMFGTVGVGMSDEMEHSPSRWTPESCIHDFYQESEKHVF